MRSKVKIIHILSHIPNPVILEYKNPEKYLTDPARGKYHLLNYPPYWVGFFAQDHHAFAAKDLLKLTDEFKVECWRPYGFGLNEPHEEIVDGIRHRVFPAYKFEIPQVGSMTWSDSLLDALLKEIENNNVIINLSVGHAWFHIKLMFKLKKAKKKFGLVAVHRSGGFRNMAFSQLEDWKKLFKWYYLIESYFDARSLRHCDHYFVGSLVEANYLQEKHPEISSSFFMEGIDFSRYRVLSIKEKENLRDQLHLPIDKKILIAYGNWHSTDYAYQHLLKVFRNIKQTEAGKDLELLMIGGYKSQDLYQEAIDSGAIMVERVAKELFIKYLEVCDIFTQACFNWGFINFGGFGTAMIEALACGMPVISGNIIHFPGTLSERSQIGFDMPTEKDLFDNIIYLKNNLIKYPNCRKLAQKYYDIKDTRFVLLNKYRELAQKYFGL